jgi:RNA 3'-terminal phosphate cyclase (ATP)
VLTIDGSRGEGGGQILRTSLALSLVTGTPFRIERLRAGRQKPGLQRQHLTAVQAAAAIGGGDVEGAAIGSQALVFRPGRVKPGAYRFAIGTAGSTGLVLQTILPPLLRADGTSTLTLEGGTHNPFAPPFDFLARAFLPLLVRMGARVEAELDRPGFYPAGGGHVTVIVDGGAPLAPPSLQARGTVVRRRARALLSRLARHIGERELAVVQSALGWAPEEREVVVLDAAGPGNALLLEVESEHVTEVFTAFGERGVPAERVAATAVQEAQRYVASDVPVGEHLADQLLIPLALARGGSFRTLPLTGHTRTNMEVIREFVPVKITATEVGDGVMEVTVRG